MFSFSTPGQQQQQQQGQQQQQPSQQQQQQVHTPQQPGQQQQQQPQQNFGATLNLSDLNRPGQSQSQPGPQQFGSFGVNQQPQQPFQTPPQFGQQQYQPHSSWASPAPAQSQLQPTPPPQQAPVTYVPGYLSKIRSTRPYASPARGSEGHSPPGRDADGAGLAHSNSLASLDADTTSGSSSRPGPSSPPSRFTWSSSSRAGTAEPDKERSPWPAGSQSVFGAGGLRGSRRTPALGASATPGLQHSMSSSRLRSTTSPGRADMEDDDDAPPIEGLTEMEASPQLHSSNGFSSSFSSQNAVASPDTPSRPSAEPFNPFTSTPAQNSSAQGSGSAALATPSKDTTFPASMRTVLVYGFPTALTHAVLEHFGHFGDIVNRAQVSGEDGSAATGSVAGVECISITYAAPWSALRALRRSGDTVAGACYVGVRWADDNLHREALLNGLNAAAFASSSGGPPASSSSSSTSVVPSASAGTGTGTGAGARAALTPTFGRPISVVGTPSAALRTTSGTSASPSPFAGLTSNLFAAGGAKNSSNLGTPVRGGSVPPVSLFAGQNSPAVGAKDAGGQEQKAGLMGRIEGAIFGW